MANVNARAHPNAPAAVGQLPVSRDLDLDAVDAALDRGDLDAVRQLLGLSLPLWRAVLAQL